MFAVYFHTFYSFEWHVYDQSFLLSSLFGQCRGSVCWSLHLSGSGCSSDLKSVVTLAVHSGVRRCVYKMTCSEAVWCGKNKLCANYFFGIDMQIWCFGHASDITHVYAGSRARRICNRSVFNTGATCIWKPVQAAVNHCECCHPERWQHLIHLKLTFFMTWLVFQICLLEVLISRLWMWW